MLTISNVTNSKAASAYYQEKDNYYSQSSSSSSWYGKAAKELGLVGDVESKIFEAVLAGNLPNKIEIKRVGELRRSGTDLTFSAPKSLSIQALIGGDSNLIKAHHTAVERALAYVESLAQSRVTRKNITITERTENLIIAQFLHDLSREMDPQLHTHCVIINATQRADGKWRALVNSEFYHQKMFIGAYYRSELAKEVMSLGYQIRIENNDGRFELAHINQAQIQAFSKRSTSIINYLKNHNLDRNLLNGKQLQFISLKTRKKKKLENKNELFKVWEVESTKNGIDFHPQLSDKNNQFLLDDASEFLQLAINHLSEKEAVFSHQNLIRYALEFGVGKVDLNAINKSIESTVNSNTLIKYGQNYTTHEARVLEGKILEIEENSRFKFNPILESAYSSKLLENTNLNVGQKNAVVHVLATSNQIVGIQGNAGTGKTTTLKVLKSISNTQNLRIIGLAPSSSASRELGSTGIESKTIHSFLSQKYNQLDRNTLLVVDEASMISTNVMLQLLNKVIECDARVILIGDVGQLSAVDAGKPFAQLQKNGMSTVKITEILRQKNSNLKKAVELSVDKKVKESLREIQSHIVEITSHKDRHNQLAREYVNLNEQDRAKTLLLCGTNNNRHSINMLIRKELNLEGHGEFANCLVTKDLSQEQKRQTSSYQIGDLVVPNKDYKRISVKRNQILEVIAGKNGVVTLRDANNNKVEWTPTQCPDISIYKPIRIELSKGDLIRFTKNNYNDGYINGDRAKVIDISKNKIIVEKNDGKKLTLDLSKHHHIDYGYCQTIHSGQGQTCERMLLEAEASCFINSEKSYYVALSRAQNEVKIYTDDKELLPEAFSRQYEKSSALELEIN